MPLLFLIAHVIVGSSAARANGGVCKPVESGYGYVKVEQQGDLWTYSLHVSGPLWRSAEYRHASGLLICEACAQSQTLQATFHFYSIEGPAENPKFKRPRSSAERVARRLEVIDYPLKVLRNKDLEPYATRDDVRMGALAGYAVLYRIDKQAVLRKWPSTDAENAEHAGLLVISVMDGCVGLETSMVTYANGDNDKWAVLEELFKEVSIKRAYSEDATLRGRGGTIVQPRQPGERPRTLFDPGQ